MLQHMNLRHLPEIGKDADVLEEEDVAAAEIVMHQALQWTMRRYRERCMNAPLSKWFVRHTGNLVAMQSRHIERVRDHGLTLLRLLAGELPEDASDEDKKRRIQRIRKVKIALIMHECAKFNPDKAYPGGVNPDHHLEETCDDTFMFVANTRRKRKFLAEEIAAMIEISGSPYSMHWKRTGVRAPDTIEEGIVCAAVNLDAVDFWGAQDIIWLRQHPERLILPSLAESVTTSFIFARNMRDKAIDRIWNAKVKRMNPNSLELIMKYGIDLWKRSERYFSFFERRTPKTMLEFRAGWNEFFRAELEREGFGWCISRHPRRTIT